LSALANVSWGGALRGNLQFFILAFSGNRKKKKKTNSIAAEERRRQLSDNLEKRELNRITPAVGAGNQFADLRGRGTAGAERARKGT